MESAASNTKHGTLDGLKRIEEICAYTARGFDTLPAALCPGIVGKQLAIQLKALNSRLWKLHESLSPPVALSNKLCLGASTLTWGGIDTDPDWVLVGGRLPKQDTCRS